MLTLRKPADTSTVGAIHERKDTRRVLMFVNAKRAEFGLQPISQLPSVTKKQGGLGSITEALSTKYIDVRTANTSRRRGFTIELKRHSRLSDNSRGAVVQSARYVLPKYAVEWINKFNGGEFPGMIRS